MIKLFARQIAMTIAAIALLSAPVQAQQPSAASIALAKEIVTLKGVASVYGDVIPTVFDDSRRALLQVNPMLARPLDEVVTKLKADNQARISEVLDVIARVYASRFTEAELKDVLAFYKSPLGQKINREEPRALEDSLTSVNEWANRFSEEAISKIRAEMRRRGHEL
jgi:hypothetical protein